MPQLTKAEKRKRDRGTSAGIRKYFRSTEFKIRDATYSADELLARVCARSEAPSAERMGAGRSTRNLLGDWVARHWRFLGVLFAAPFLRRIPKELYYGPRVAPRSWQ
jgi:hypothetical protein